MFSFTFINKKLLVLVLSLVLILPFVVNAETEVENNISVKASSDDSSASIKSVINGETIEDVTITGEETISYTSSHTVEKTTSNINTSSSVSDDRQLRELLNRLVSLLSLYVSKLAL